MRLVLRIWILKREVGEMWAQVRGEAWFGYGGFLERGGTRMYLEAWKLKR